MRLYRALIRPKINYGCLVCGSASREVLRRLDIVMNEAMQISTGAFESTPVQSLRVVTNEPELSLKRNDLLLRYFYKLKHHFLNPAYPSLINQNLELFLTSRRYSEQPIICRLRQVISRYNIPTQPVLPYKTPTQYSWALKGSDIVHDITDVKKEVTLDSVFRSRFKEQRQRYSDYEVIYTDGWKRENGVGAAAVMGAHTRKVSLPAVASIVTAELKAIELSLSIIRNTPYRKYIVATDSLSSIASIESKKEDHLVQRLLLLFHELIEGGNSIVVTRIPSHIRVRGNERVDEMAKQVAQ